MIANLGSSKKNRVVTEAYLDKKLDNFVTKKYLDEKLENFVTKSYLDRKLENYPTRDYMEERLVYFKDEITGEISEDMKSQTAEILQGVDKIVSRFDTVMKEQAAHASLHGRITDQLHDHDKRLKKLETRV